VEFAAMTGPDEKLLVFVRQTSCYERFSIQNGYNRRGDNSTSSTNRGGSTDMLMTVVAMMAVVMGVAVAVVAMVVMVLAVAPIVC